ncbi:hypothetical protein AB0P07_08255 [Streptomyces sp. NPDC085944]|uniref:hypothetical protein n=1 Tax=Streptomyces sp. NPDC085944 TaxID=3154962 RepID=UPI00341E0A4E
MTARDDILTGKWQQDPDPRQQALRLGELLDQVEREHAQQLADRIRTTDHPDDYVDMFDNGATWAADLINPR